MIGELLFAKRVRVAQDHKGWHSVECRAGVLPKPVRHDVLCGVGPGDALVENESERQKSARTLAQQEPSSISGIKRSTTDVEAFRRADAEVEKAMIRARKLNEHLATPHAESVGVCVERRRREI